jgi:hypothetical protein
VYAPGVGVDELRQRVDVGALQFLQRAPFEDEPRHVVRQRELLEHLHGGGRGFRLDVALQRRQLELVEEDLRQLRRRIDVEFLAGHLVDLRAACGELLLDVFRVRGELRSVDANAGAFDVHEHGDERHLQRAVEGGELLPVEQREEDRIELQGEVGAFSGEVERGLDRNGTERHGFRAAAADVFFP